MKILQVIDNLYPGGAERVMVNLCNWLHAEGVQIEVALIVGKGTELLNQLNPAIPVHFISRYNKFDINSAKKLANLLSRFELAHIHMRHNYRYVKIVALLYAKTIPLLFHDHYGKIAVDRQVPAGFRTFFRPHHYIGVSNELTNWAIERLRIFTTKVFLLENVVEKLPIGNQNKVADLVMLSNIKPSKNQLFALEIVKSSTWSLDLYGGSQDEIYAEKVKGSIQSQQMSGKVKWVSNCSEAQKELNKYRLGLHTSISETGPLVIIEYLAQGLPFVAYRTGEAAEKISQDFPEFFMDNFEVEGWVGRIRELLTSPPDKEKMAYVFEKHFSKQAYVYKCLKIYQSVLRS